MLETWEHELLGDVAIVVEQVASLTDRGGQIDPSPRARVGSAERADGPSPRLEPDK